MLPALGVVVAIVIVIGAVVGFSRVGGFNAVFGSLLLSSGLIWALFTTAKKGASWERKVASIMIIFCMIIGGILIVWPTIKTKLGIQIPYTFRVRTQSAVREIKGNDNISTQPQSKSAVEVSLDGSCKSSFTLNESGSLMDAGEWVESTFEASKDCHFTELKIELGKDQLGKLGKYDDWAFDKIQIVQNNNTNSIPIVNEIGEWAVGDSKKTPTRMLVKKIPIIWPK